MRRWVTRPRFFEITLFETELICNKSTSIVPVITGINRFDSFVDGGTVSTMLDHYKNNDEIVVGLGYAPELLLNLDAKIR